MSSTPLREVRLLGMPLPLHAEARQHHDELMREFALMAHPRADSSADVPIRLLELVDRVNADFSGFSAGPERDIEAACARGETTLDLTYQVPEAAGLAAQELGAMLDEADKYCRSGDLLTLAVPDLVRRFRRWWLDQFVDQLAGAPPRPWDGPLAVEPRKGSIREVRGR